jgi:hypothetical protein
MCQRVLREYFHSKCPHDCLQELYKTIKIYQHRNDLKLKIFISLSPHTYPSAKVKLNTFKQFEFILFVGLQNETNKENVMARVVELFFKNETINLKLTDEYKAILGN